MLWCGEKFQKSHARRSWRGGEDSCPLLPLLPRNGEEDLRNLGLFPRAFRSPVFAYSVMLQPCASHPSQNPVQGWGYPGPSLCACPRSPARPPEHPPTRANPASARIPSSKAQIPVDWRGRESGMAVSCQAARTPCPRGRMGDCPQICVLEPGEGGRSELLTQNGSGSPWDREKSTGRGGGTSSAVPKLS